MFSAILWMKWRYDYGVRRCVLPNRGLPCLGPGKGMSRSLLSNAQPGMIAHYLTGAQYPASGFAGHKLLGEVPSISGPNMKVCSSELHLRTLAYTDMKQWLRDSNRPEVKAGFANTRSTVVMVESAL